MGSLGEPFFSPSEVEPSCGRDRTDETDLNNERNNKTVGLYVFMLFPCLKGSRKTTENVSDVLII